MNLSKEARYVLRLAHSGTYRPLDQAHLLAKVRERVQPLGGQVMNLRVSRQAIEFDLFCKPDSPLPSFLAALEPVGVFLTDRRLDLPPGPVIPEDTLKEARALFREERYWEAHEVLEGLWKVTSGSEKQLLQGLILVAAAMVHAQKNEEKVVWTMLEDAVRRLENQPSLYHGIDIHGIMMGAKKMIAAKSVEFPTI